MEQHLNKQVRAKLKNAGLNPDNPSFIHEAAYAPFKHSHFIWTKHGRVTVDYYIWKNWFSKTKRNQLKLSIFDMGVCKRPQKLTDAMLYREIADQEAGDDESVRQKLIGKSSIKSKLKEDLNFDLDRFNLSQNYEKLKLLKILYWYEKSPLNPDSVKLISILAHPSMANQDQRLIGKESPYGKALTELKFEVRKEIDESFALKVADDTISIINAWDIAHYNVMHLVNREIPIKDILTELKRIKEDLSSVFNRLELDELTPVYESKIMEAFYLKVHQLDHISRVLDIQKAMSYICYSSHSKKLLAQRHLLPPSFKDLIIDEPESYLNDNLERVTQLAYQKELVTQSEMKYIKRKLERVEVLLEIYNQQRRGADLQRLSLSFLIAALQEILLAEHPDDDDPEAFYRNDFFKSKRNVRTLSSALKNFEKEKSFEEEIFEIIWIAKIERRLYAFRGRLEPYLLSVEISEQINTIVSLLTAVPHLNRMNALHNYFIDQVFLTEQETVGRYQDEFCDAVKRNSGFDCIICTRRVFSLFDDQDTRLFFTHLIINGIKGQYNFDGWGRDGNIYLANILNHQLVMEINRDERKFILHRFMPIVSDTEVELLRKNGLSNLILS